MSAPEAAVTVAGQVGRAIGELLGLALNVVLATCLYVGLTFMFGETPPDWRAVAQVVLFTMVFQTCKRDFVKMVAKHYPRTRVPQ